MPILSIIIPCYNAVLWIQETIGSVLAQNYSDLEIILIDDGSTDGSANLVESVFPFVKVIRSENRGVSHARNLGIKHARGDYIKYLDADDLIPSGTIFEKEIYVLKNSKADILYGNWQKYVMQPNGSFTLGEIVVPNIPESPESALFLGDSWTAIHSCMYKSHVARAVTWNESLSITEDACFLTDCASIGFKFRHFPETVAIYRLHKDSATHKSYYRTDVERLRNSIQYKTKWEQEGALSEDRRNALLTKLSRIAFSFACSHFDWEKAQTALNVIYSISPSYTPNTEHSKWAKLSRWLGMKWSLKFSYYYHKFRIRLGGKVYSGPPIS